ncbi:Uncharacterised protein [Mycobacteroides abscessus subsp. abscessus]|nr:Uncharacterised protein [Mycobacteroides abscessus subsp. abscessus]
MPAKLARPGRSGMLASLNGPTAEISTPAV